MAIANQSFVGALEMPRLTIFDGGHEMIPSALIKWLEDMKQNHVAD